MYCKDRGAKSNPAERKAAGISADGGVTGVENGSSLCISSSRVPHGQWVECTEEDQYRPPYIRPPCVLGFYLELLKLVLKHPRAVLFSPSYKYDWRKT